MAGSQEDKIKIIRNFPSKVISRNRIEKDGFFQKERFFLPIYISNRNFERFYLSYLQN